MKGQHTFQKTCQSLEKYNWRNREKLLLQMMEANTFYEELTVSTVQTKEWGNLVDWGKNSIVKFYDFFWSKRKTNLICNRLLVCTIELEKGQVFFWLNLLQIFWSSVADGFNPTTIGVKNKCPLQLFLFLHLIYCPFLLQNC